jgi:hypothetical protein
MNKAVVLSALVVAGGLTAITAFKTPTAEQTLTEYTTHACGSAYSDYLVNNIVNRVYGKAVAGNTPELHWEIHEDCKPIIETKLENLGYAVNATNRIPSSVNTTVVKVVAE